MPTPANPHAALCAALANMSNVAGNKINPQFRTRYVTLDSLLDAVRPVLAEHDLALTQLIISEPGIVGVETQVVHASGHVFSFGRLAFKADGLSPQQVSSAVTYARRITLSAAMGIAPDLDDDGKAASAAPTAKAPTSLASHVKAADLPRAVDYLRRLGWLAADQGPEHLSPARLQKIADDPAKFLEAVNKTLPA